MSQQPSTSLLWINKDATNVHRRKHVAEVNAHVQKTTSKRRTPKPPPGPKRGVVPTQKLTRREPSLPTSGKISEASDSDSDDHGVDSSLPARTVSVADTTPEDSLIVHELGAYSWQSEALIFSSYLEGDVASAIELRHSASEDHRHDLNPEELFTRLKTSIPKILNAADPLPGFFTGLSNHDKMLVHTHLTYMPQMFYGFSSQSSYCPVRTASVVNMLKAPIAAMWVLISLDMFLETARKSSARTSVILRRKSYAYQLMSSALYGRSQMDEDSMLLGPVSAAIAEMFCGDPAKAITHLNGIDAFIAARGGMEYVKKMELMISMPVFAVSAYRTILQDNLKTIEAFERAQNSFYNSILSLRTWNNNLTTNAVSRSHNTSSPSPLQDEGFDGGFDLDQGVQELQEARARAFIHHPIIRRFVSPDYVCNRPGEKIDHFILLYNLSRALADHGTNVKKAVQFIEDLVEDIEVGGSSRGADSSIKLPGVLRLITYRQAQTYPNHPSEGIARAWGALDALEVMKLLSPEMQQLVLTGLYHLLTGQQSDQALTDQDIASLQAAMTTEWRARHIPLQTPDNSNQSERDRTARYKKNTSKPRNLVSD